VMAKATVVRFIVCFSCVLFRHLDLSMMKTRAASRRTYAAPLIDCISPLLPHTLCVHPEQARWPAHCCAALTLSAAQGDHLAAVLRRPQGIMSHSNSLLAIGAATRLRNSVRICGSFHRICMARCSICAFCTVGGWLFSSANC